jgi:serine/threonine-protein kinase
MNRSLEQAWLEISTDLDEVLDLDVPARQAWLASLETHDPDRAERVRGYVLDLEKLENEHFLARALPLLEHVHGKPITEYCDSARLDLRARIELFLNVLAAVSHAHRRRVIHRDSKPANIVVTADGRVKLLDAGIGRGVDIGTGSDVYSLGVLLFELTTGELPYRPKRATPGALEKEIVSVQPPLASRVARKKQTRRALRGDLDTIILTALRKEQAQRYSTVAAFAEDLQRHLQSEPIVARNQSSWYRARKFLIRNKLPVLAASALLLAMIAAWGMALSQTHVTREHATKMSRHWPRPSGQ